jgi:hypothetical protein
MREVEIVISVRVRLTGFINSKDEAKSLTRQLIEKGVEEEAIGLPSGVKLLDVKCGNIELVRERL